ncbi:YciI family protein [Dongia sp.]|uniref:YciI family protein n=1 Tax=Dongia sp. TaxID=1977262 RepID=UPI003752D10E
MKYMLLIYVDEAKGAQVAKEMGVAQMTAPYIAYAEALQKAGVIRGGDRLQPTSTATTVKVAEGKTQVLNGPYAETKEQLGGYFMIDVPDLDTALSWAARCPGAAHGTVEVRPLWTMTT